MIRLIGSKYSILIIWLLVFAAFYVATYIHQTFFGSGYNPNLFVSPDNIANILGQAALVGILASGMTLVIVSENIDLSVGSQLGMFGALSAWLLSANMGFGLPAFLALPLTLVVGALIGAIQGVFVAYVAIPSFIVTLAGLLSFKGVQLILAKRTIPINDSFVTLMGSGILPERLFLILVALVTVGSIYLIFRRNKLGAPLMVGAILAGTLGFWLYTEAGLPIRFLVMLGMATVIAVVAARHIFGRSVYAIGSNSKSAFYAGIPVKRTIVGVFALMGLVAAGAGIISSGIQMAADPGAGELMELYAIAACVIGGTSLSGGKGSVWGSTVGALIMATIRNGLSCLGVGNPGEKIVLGVVLLIAVTLDLRFGTADKDAVV